uniref:Reverse transcriptase Ty1/copia-type domain-containing protein n=1 Tax=Solanum lycopersicum TaxID=4081 RepID=A0A3Q7GHF7_SOLLC
VVYPYQVAYELPQALAATNLQNTDDTLYVDSRASSHMTHNSGKIFHLLYVDDIIVTGSNPSHALELVLQRGKEFAMKELGNLNFFFGVEVTNFDGGIHLSQSKYVVELLDKNEITFAKAISTHLAQKHGIHEVVGILVETSFYKMIVESLQYLTLTRPNIIHVVNLASQFMQNPKVHIFKGRSTTGYSIYLGANCISWTSKKQSTVARSSAEAEYRALATTASEMTLI